MSMTLLSRTRDPSLTGSPVYPGLGYTPVHRAAAISRTVVHSIKTLSKPYYNFIKTSLKPHDNPINTLLNPSKTLLKPS